MAGPKYVESTLGDHVGCLGTFIGIMAGFGLLCVAAVYAFGFIVYLITSATAA